MSIGGVPTVTGITDVATDADLERAILAHLRHVAMDAVDTWIHTMKQTGLASCVAAMNEGRAELLLALADDVTESADYFMQNGGPSTEPEWTEWAARHYLIRTFERRQFMFDPSPDDPYAPDPLQDDPNDTVR